VQIGFKSLLNCFFFFIPNIS